MDENKVNKEQETDRKTVNLHPEKEDLAEVEPGQQPKKDEQKLNQATNVEMQPAPPTEDEMT